MDNIMKFIDEIGNPEVMNDLKCVECNNNDINTIDLLYVSSNCDSLYAFCNQCHYNEFRCGLFTNCRACEMADGYNCYEYTTYALKNNKWS